MKLLKRSLVLLGCAIAAAAAFTACELELGGDDRLITSQGSGAGSDLKKDENGKEYYPLETSLASTLQGKSGAIDVAKFSATLDTIYTAGPIDWKNPLYGSTDLEGFTLVADLYYTAGDHYDGLLYFYDPDNKGDSEAVNFIGLFEDGNIRGSSTSKVEDSFFESVGNIAVDSFVAKANSWNTVAVTISSDGNITYYMNGAEGINTSGGKGTNATWDRIKAQLTEELPNIGIGVGNCWWPAGFVDDGNLLRDIRVYPTALTAAQVAKISAGGDDDDEPSAPPAEEIPSVDPEDWDTSDDAISYTGTIKNSLIPAFDVEDGGFTVEFKATMSAGTGDWTSQVLSYKGFHVTIPNLDPWNNTVDEADDLKGKNAYPTASGAALKNGLDYDSAFDGVEHTIKLVFTEDSITYYLDGKEWVEYTSSVLEGKISDFIGYYVEGLKAGEVVFNAASLEIKDVTISKE